jgi:hypothetical protein
MNRRKFNRGIATAAALAAAGVPALAAPTGRVISVDVGDMTAQEAERYLRTVMIKNKVASVISRFTERADMCTDEFNNELASAINDVEGVVCSIVLTGPNDEVHGFVYTTDFGHGQHERIQLRISRQPYFGRTVDVVHVTMGVPPGLDVVHEHLLPRS